MVSDAANADICLYFAPNNAFNYFFEGKPVWHIAKARLIIALCTRASTPRKSGERALLLFPDNLKAPGHTGPSSRAEGAGENRLWVFIVNLLCGSFPAVRMGGSGEIAVGVAVWREESVEVGHALVPAFYLHLEGHSPREPRPQGEACTGWDAGFFKFSLSVAVYISHCFVVSSDVRRAQNSESRESVVPVWAHDAPCLGLSPAVGVGPHGPRLYNGAHETAQGSREG